MKFKNYDMNVCFGNGQWANGAYTVKAISEDEAINDALYELGKRFSEAFPDLSIDITVEVINVW